MFGSFDESLLQALQDVVKTFLVDWKMDELCNKTMLLAVALDDGHFAAISGNNVHINMDVFQSAFDKQVSIDCCI